MWRWMALVCVVGGLEQTQVAPRVHIPDAPARRGVVQAIEGAQRRLARPDCQRLFTDFKDTAGRPLAGRLEASTFSPSDYLARQILFVNGDDAPQCRRDEAVAAFTAPGHQVVHVCTTTFTRRFQRSPVVMEILIIHEMLHTLGLGESPPSSSAITGQVTKRCGSS